VTNPALLVSNDSNAVKAGLVSTGTNPLTVTVPASGSVNGCGTGTLVNNTAGGGSVLISSRWSNPCSGIVGEGFTGPNCGGIHRFDRTPAVFNFFRPSGRTRHSALWSRGLRHAGRLGASRGIPSARNRHCSYPLERREPQTSSGNSVYHAFTLTMTKRFSHGMELLSGWTYSHTIDDSTDLSTLLNPQDNNNPTANEATPISTSGTGG